MSTTFVDIVEEEVNEFNDLEWWEFYRVNNVDGSYYDSGADDVESAIEESEYPVEEVESVELISYTVKCETETVYERG